MSDQTWIGDFAQHAPSSEGGRTQGFRHFEPVLAYFVKEPGSPVPTPKA